MPSTRRTARTPCACTRWPWAPWTWTAPGSRTTSWAWSASCSGSGATRATRRPGRGGGGGTGWRAAEPLYRLLHQTIDAVGSQYGELRYNVAIARLTELNNAITRYVRDRGSAPREAVQPLVLMVAPLAPHIAAELWERLGRDQPLDDVAGPGE